MKFFFDNNLSPLLARALAVFLQQHGHDAIHLRDKYPNNHSIADEDWMVDLAKEGDWAVVTNDRGLDDIKRQGPLREKLGLPTFFVGRSFLALPGPTQAGKLLTHIDDLIEAAERKKRSEVYRIGANGIPKPCRTTQKRK